MLEAKCQARSSRIRASSLILLPLVAMMVAGCGKTYTYKYRITIAIRDHGELKSASNVVSVQESPTFMHGAAPPVLCGEATVVPLSNNRYLFALLNGIYREPTSGRAQWYSSPTPVLLQRYGLPLGWPNLDDSGILALPNIRRPITLASYEMPNFVTFKDVSDPASMMQVDPDHPEPTLGKGVRFEKVTLEVTDDWVTRGKISNVLPWLNWWKQYVGGPERARSFHSHKSIQFWRCNRLTE